MVARSCRYKPQANHFTCTCTNSSTIHQLFSLVFTTRANHEWAHVNGSLNNFFSLETSVPFVLSSVGDIDSWESCIVTYEDGLFACSSLKAILKWKVKLGPTSFHPSYCLRTAAVVSIAVCPPPQLNLKTDRTAAVQAVVYQYTQCTALGWGGEVQAHWVRHTVPLHTDSI